MQERRVGTRQNYKIVMNREARDASSQSVIYIDAPVEESCTCLPLSSLYQASQEEGREHEENVPATEELNSHLRSLLATSFPRSTPLSILHLHISQLEPIHSVQQAVYRRSRYHAPDDFLEQVLVSARRVIRRDDQLLVHARTGAVIIFPEVDLDAIQAIEERVYQSISLLRAETVIPPLRRVTNILIGIGSYPKPAINFEQMLYHASLAVRTLTLRPAISRQPRSMSAAHLLVQAPVNRDQQLLTGELWEGLSSKKTSVPFLQLPSQLPRRLKQLVPYQLALKMRCAPVGRDHDRLTIAMADPSDSNALSQLEEVTGLSIFAVSCDPEALDALLAHKW